MEEIRGTMLDTSWVDSGKGEGWGAQRTEDRTGRRRGEGEGGRKAEGPKTHHRWSELEPAGNAMHTVTPCDTLQI